MHTSFELFFQEPDGKKTVVKALPAQGPPNAGLNMGIEKIDIVYNVGDQCALIPVDVLFCLTVSIQAFFTEFNNQP